MPSSQEDVWVWSAGQEAWADLDRDLGILRGKRVVVGVHLDEVTQRQC